MRHTVPEEPSARKEASVDTQQMPADDGPTVVAPTSSAPTAAGEAPLGPGSASPGGTTWISDQIVAKIAGLAAREVDGVAGLRSEDGKRGWGVPRSRETDLATVTVADDEAAIDLRLVVRDGTAIPAVVDAVRARVVARVQEATGMRVARVDIGVVDVVTADEVAADDAGGEDAE